jgi:Uma2 family endonuclease
VVDRTELVNEVLWSEQSILTQGSSIKFIAEVVSSNWQNDYALDTPRLSGTRILGSQTYLKIAYPFGIT